MTQTKNGTQTTYTYDNDNKLTTIGATSLTYDNNGNRTANGSKALTYDFDNRLKTHTASPAPQIAFKYDGEGNRLEKSEGGTAKVRYINDLTQANERVLMARSMAFDSPDYFVYGGKDIISHGGADGSTRQYYLDDGLGNARYFADVKGDAVELHTMDPYGTPLTGNLPSGINYKTQESDEETGLYYLRARYYDPATATFLSKDPVEGALELPISQNGYSYAHNDPINYSDPSGKAVNGLCVSLGCGLGAYGSVGGCLLKSSNGQVGLSGTLSGGGISGATVGIAGQVYSNPTANNISDLNGTSPSVGISFKEPFGINANYGLSPSGQTTSTALGLSLGPNIPFGTFTSTIDLTGTITLR